MTNRTLWVSKGILAAWLAILAWYLFAPSFNKNVLVTFLFLFLLYGYVSLTSLGMGRMLVRRLHLPLSNTEFNLLAALVGFAVLSLTITFVGLAGWLTRAGILTCLIVTGIIASYEWQDIANDLSSAIRKIHLPQGSNRYEVLLFILGAAIIPLLLINVLTPVWDYDALLYHLEISRQFISHGRIFFNPEVFRSAYPFLGEMLFVVGMVFRLDSFAKLVSLSYTFLFIGSTYAFAKRFFSREIGLTAVGILISTPIWLLWATWASIDFAWGSYELWSVYAVCLWLAYEKKETTSWLVLAGVMSGLAASTKYISLPSLLIIASIILWKTVQGSKHSFRNALFHLLTFGIAAGLVMGVWYIKNWIWTGNPIYPLLFGGTGWDALKDQVFNNDYMKTFGLERSLLNFILLPYNVYAKHNQFSTLPLEIIHPLLWLAILFPFITRSNKYSTISFYAAVYYVWWFFGSQVIRFLLPVSAFIAILAAGVLERFPSLIKNTLKYALIVGLMIFNLVYQFFVLRNSGTFSYVAGRTSADEILQVFVDDYQVKQFIQQTLKVDEKALFLWDGRGYYCDSRCIPDNDQSHAVRLALHSPEPTDLAQVLKAKGITHLMLSATDRDWFVTYHDPHKYHFDAQQYFDDTFLPACGKSVYKDEGMELFEITCD